MSQTEFQQILMWGSKRLKEFGSRNKDEMEDLVERIREINEGLIRILSRRIMED